MADKNKEVTIVEPQHLKSVDLSNILIDKPEMFAEKILGTKAIGGSITFPIQMHSLSGTQSVTTTIPFYVSNDFSLGNFSNEWGDLCNMDFANTLGQWLNAIHSVQGEAQVTLQSENMTSKVWKGSKYSGMNVECLFLSTRRTFNPLKIISNLAASVLPSRLEELDKTTAQSFNKAKVAFADNIVTPLGGAIAEGAGILNKAWKDAVNAGTKYVSTNIKKVGLIAPLYYGLKPDGGGMVPLQDSTLTLQIGEYFVADSLLVQSIGNVTFSKEIVAPASMENSTGGVYIYDNSPRGDDYGYPLWAKCSLSLIPHKMVTKEKFQSWFRYKKTSTSSPIDGIKNEIVSALGGIGNIVDTHFDLP